MKVHKPLLLSAALVASHISAAFMSITLFFLAPPGWWSYAALALGVVLEILKSGLSVKASEQWRESQYAGLVVSFVFVGVVMVFAVWAGQERFTHGIAADNQRLAALHDVRSGQVAQEIARRNAELTDLANHEPILADVAEDQARIDDLYEQAKAMRARMALTKAEELEATSILSLRNDMQRKKDEAAEANAAMRAYRQDREAQINKEIEALQAEQLAIATQTGRIVSTSYEATAWILKVVVILIEAAPIYIFWLYGSSMTAPVISRTEDAAPGMTAKVDHLVEQEREADLVSDVAHTRAVASDAAPVPQSNVIAYVEPESSAGEATEPSMIHPRINVAMEYVENLDPGTKISTDAFKSGVGVGSDKVAMLLSHIAETAGIVAKDGRSWVRV